MQARLTIRKGEGRPKSLALDNNAIIRIGRSKSNDVIANDSHVSRVHAELSCKDGRWYVRDNDSRNKTFVNGSPVSPSAPLRDGDFIGIGDTEWEFRLGNVTADSHDGFDPDERATVPEPEPEPDGASQGTPFELNEVTALFHFVDQSHNVELPQELVLLALKTVHRLTQATMTGFLSLDDEEPLPKMVLPDLDKVDVHLSRQLTRLVQEKQAMVWLVHDQLEMSSESIMGCADALCAPVQLEHESPFGALHVYRSGKTFSGNEAALCEALARSLAKRMLDLRNQQALKADNTRLRQRFSGNDAESIVGDCRVMQELRADVARAANVGLPVLIQGETGSGKELIALALHRQSERAKAPFIAVNCGALPESIAKRELFGHCKGAFTGAERDVPGYLEQADGGTLFLDEVGELSIDLQVALLRVLERKPFRRLGGERDVTSDLRLVAATNRELIREVSEGTFREDLYYRLNVLEVHAPPLRDHLEDVPALAKHFLTALAREFRRKEVPRLSDRAVESLQHYHWPGNVRQFRSVLQRAVAMSDGMVLEPDDLALPSTKSEHCAESLLSDLNLRDLEQHAIKKALQRSRGQMNEAAALLGVHVDTLRNKMKKYGIDKPESGK